MFGSWHATSIKRKIYVYLPFFNNLLIYLWININAPQSLQHFVRLGIVLFDLLPVEWEPFIVFFFVIQTAQKCRRQFSEVFHLICAGISFSHIGSLQIMYLDLVVQAHLHCIIVAFLYIGVIVPSVQALVMIGVRKLMQ